MTSRDRITRQTHVAATRAFEHGNGHDSEVQENFDHWHDTALKEPVRIVTDGRETAYLVSAEMFNEMWSYFRRAMRVRDLSEREMGLISAAEIAPEDVYELTHPRASVPAFSPPPPARR